LQQTDVVHTLKVVEPLPERMRHTSTNNIAKNGVGGVGLGDASPFSLDQRYQFSTITSNNASPYTLCSNRQLTLLSAIYILPQSCGVLGRLRVPSSRNLPSGCYNEAFSKRVMWITRSLKSLHGLPVVQPRQKLLDVVLQFFRERDVTGSTWRR
ncbi:hypothetical protein RvY_18951, partial [Ramazzottius varieornatus]